MGVGVRLLVAALGVTVELAAGGCSTSDPAPASGAVTGTVSVCYGPGPNLNLTPIVTVPAVQGGRTVATIKVPDTRGQHVYRLTLPPGNYEIRVPIRGGRVSAHVDSGRTTTADIPGTGCT